MRKFITITAIVAVVTFYLTACKKSTDTEQQQTTLQKIQAKWQIDTYYENDHYLGTDHIKNITGTASDYLDFRTDGKIYFSFQGFRDTVTYNLVSDTKLLIDGVNNYDIRTLTSNSFIIYGKDMSSSGDFLEELFTMKK